MEGNLCDLAIIEPVGFCHLRGGGAALVCGLGSWMDGLVVQLSRNYEIFCVSHNECHMIVMSSSEHRRDGFGVAIELFLVELAHCGIHRFSNDDGEVRMREV
jgi:hypothetical protein